MVTLPCCIFVEVLPSLPLLHATPVRNLLRHLHAVQGLVFTFPTLSSRLTAQLCDAKFCRCCRLLQRMTFAGKSAGHTELRKNILSSIVSLLEPGRAQSGQHLFSVSSIAL